MNHSDPFPKFPVELKELPQWVFYRLKPTNKGKPTKVPYNPRTGEEAKTNDPNTWGSYEEAIQSNQRYKGNGLGFVTQESDPYTGTDLDDCIDDQGTISAKASAIVAELDSYTEISPSDHGLRIWTRAKLPPKGRKKGDLEMYDDVRFFTVTGNHLAGTPLEIHNRQTEVEAIHAQYFPSKPKREEAPRPAVALSLDDQELIEKACQNERTGADFARLYRGDWRGLHPSQSEADLALCNRLAFWCGGDKAQMDRIFRGSDLMRDKWDKVHHSDGSTYGQGTIDKAAAGATAYYDPTFYDQTQAHEEEPSTLKARFKDVAETRAPAKVDAASALNPDDIAAYCNAALIEENARLRAENARLKAERDQLKKVLRHEHYDGNTRTLLANVVLDERKKEDEGRFFLSHSSNPQLADRYNMSESTVQRTMRRLKKGKIVETLETKVRERNGIPLKNPITEDVTVIFRPGRGLLSQGELPITERDKDNRRRAQEVRRLAKLAQEAECPICGEVGCLHLVCSNTGQVIEAPEECIVDTSPDEAAIAATPEECIVDIPPSAPEKREYAPQVVTRRGSDALRERRNGLGPQILWDSPSPDYAMNGDGIARDAAHVPPMPPVPPDDHLLDQWRVSR